MKVNARNNNIRKLTNSEWVQSVNTKNKLSRPLLFGCQISMSCFFARTNTLNPALHDCCRIITGWLKPANVTSIHLLAGIASPYIRESVSGHAKRQRQTTQTNHQFYDWVPSAGRLKSRNVFLGKLIIATEGRHGPQRWTEDVAKAVGEKRDAWKMVEYFRDIGEQPPTGLRHLYGQKKKAARRAVDRARRKNCTESLTKILAKRWNSRRHGIELRMEGT